MWATAGVALADVVAQPASPPVEKTLSGTLAWEDVKKPDGSTVRGRLLLTSENSEVTLPVVKGATVKGTKDGEFIDVGEFVGKQVKLTAVFLGGATKSMRAIALTSIEAKPAANDKPEASKPPQL